MRLLFPSVSGFTFFVPLFYISEISVKFSMCSALKKPSESTVVLTECEKRFQIQDVSLVTRHAFYLLWGQGIAL